jgi:IMP cyclohydrolase
MEAKTFFNYGALACYMDKELVWQYKLVLMEKNTPMLTEVVDGRSFSSRLITHKSKPLDVTIGSHTSKIFFNVISYPRNCIIIVLSWLVLHNP